MRSPPCVPAAGSAPVVYSTPDANAFFSIPVGIIRARAALPPPLPGQPGPFSLGGPGVLAGALEAAGFVDVEVRTVPSPVLLPSARECVRFQQESFGALHQMMAGLTPDERADTWAEVEAALTRFEGAGRVRRTLRDAGGGGHRSRVSLSRVPDPAGPWRTTSDGT